MLAALYTMAISPLKPIFFHVLHDVTFRAFALIFRLPELLAIYSYFAPRPPPNIGQPSSYRAATICCALSRASLHLRLGKIHSAATRAPTPVSVRCYATPSMPRARLARADLAFRHLQMHIAAGYYRSFLRFAFTIIFEWRCVPLTHGVARIRRASKRGATFYLFSPPASQ